MTASEPSKTPWAHCLQIAACVFHIPPALFWALSVREWRLLTAVLDGAADAPLRQAELEDLLSAFPDSNRSREGTARENGYG